MYQKCKVESCQKQARKGGTLCSMHACRLQRWGHLGPPKPIKLGKGRRKILERGSMTRKVYFAWTSMRRRCLSKTHKDYQWYGGSGITICEEWMTFDNFLRDMGLPKKEQSLDRIDPYGNYTPSNCRWASPHVQATNKRFLSNNTSGFRGVRPAKSGKYFAAITASYKQTYSGVQINKQAAAHEYNKLAIRIHGENARLNPVGSKEGIYVEE